MSDRELFEEIPHRFSKDYDIKVEEPYKGFIRLYSTKQGRVLDEFRYLSPFNSISDESLNGSLWYNLSTLCSAVKRYLGG